MNISTQHQEIERACASWLRENNWDREEKARQIIQSYPPPAPPSVRRLWIKAQQTMRRSEQWKEEEARELPPLAQQGWGRRDLQESMTLIASRSFLRLLQLERGMFNKIGFLVTKHQEHSAFGEEKKKLRKDYPFFITETEEDYAFLIYFDLIEIPSRLPEEYKEIELFEEKDLEWGENLLRKGKLSEKLSNFAKRYLALIKDHLRCRKILPAVYNQLKIQFTCAKAVLCIEEITKSLASSLTPALLYIGSQITSWQRALAQERQTLTPPTFLYTPEFLIFLNAHGYHKRQTLLYDLIFTEISWFIRIQQDTILIDKEKFRKQAPLPFESQNQNVRLAEQIAKLTATEGKKRGKKKKISLPLPPLQEVQETKKETCGQERGDQAPSLSHIKTAIKYALGGMGKDPFQESETERVARWFVPNAAKVCSIFSDRGKNLYAERTAHARKIISFVHSFPRKIRCLLSHPCLRKTFGMETATGCAMMVDVRAELDHFSSPGVLDMGWSWKEDTRALSHYMWVPQTHSSILRENLPFPDTTFEGLGRLLKRTKVPSPEKNLQFLPNHKIAIWDDRTKLWYVVWPVVKDVDKLELDFSNPQSMAKEGFWV